MEAVSKMEWKYLPTGKKTVYLYYAVTNMLTIIRGFLSITR